VTPEVHRANSHSIGGSASERQREGEDKGGQQDRTERDRVTRAASHGEEPTASCTATTGAADECDLIKKTRGARRCSRPPPLGAWPSGPALAFAAAPA
jgi:hypothetical protein